MSARCVVTCILMFASFWVVIWVLNRNFRWASHGREQYMLGQGRRDGARFRESKIWFRSTKLFGEGRHRDQDLAMTWLEFTLIYLVFRAVVFCSNISTNSLQDTVLYNYYHIHALRLTLPIYNVIPWEYYIYRYIG